MTTAILQDPERVERHGAIGGAIAVRLRGEQTHGRLAVIELDVPAGLGAIPLHVHPDFDETFYVLDGHVAFRVGDDAHVAGPGALVHVPGELPHTFAEQAGVGARLLLVVAPAGHERYFDDLIAGYAEPGGPPADLYPRLMARHGITPV